MRRKELLPFYGYHTKYSIGFTPQEIKALVGKFPGINKEKFNDALNGNITFQTIDGNNDDIKTALLYDGA